MMRAISPCFSCRATGQVVMDTTAGMTLVSCPTCDGRRYTVTLDVNEAIGWTTATDPDDPW